VVEKLIRGLAIEESRNLFSLFEHNQCTARALESRVIVADVLAKFERWGCRLFLARPWIPALACMFVRPGTTVLSVFILASYPSLLVRAYCKSLWTKVCKCDINVQAQMSSVLWSAVSHVVMEYFKLIIIFSV